MNSRECLVTEPALDGAKDVDVSEWEPESL